MCAIFGAVSRKYYPELVDQVILGLSKQQHRGEDSAGAVYTNGRYVKHKKGFGLISQVLAPMIPEIKAHQPTMIIAQTRYKTSGNNSTRNIPPQWIDTHRGTFGFVHNGNIPELKRKMLSFEAQAKGGVEFEYDDNYPLNDTEFMLKKIFWLMDHQYDGNMQAAIRDFMYTTIGTYSAALLHREGIYVFRDPWGNRPYFRTDGDGAIFFASETSALKGLGNIVEIKPGQILHLNPDNKKLIQVGSISKKAPLAHCIFEEIYFAKPTSRTFSDEVEANFRFRTGQKLWDTLAPGFSSGVDFVCYMPESGRHAAQGFSFQSGIPLIDVYERDPYVTKTFIHPDPEYRKYLADLKYNLIPGRVKEKNIILIDDSIVRGTTLEKRIKELFLNGATKVHVVIASPPIVDECHWGIDMEQKKDLIASDK